SHFLLPPPPPPPHIPPLSLHDALPISQTLSVPSSFARKTSPMPPAARRRSSTYLKTFTWGVSGIAGRRLTRESTRESARVDLVRSEEHTSELQSPYDIVCRLLLEKIKK